MNNKPDKISVPQHFPEINMYGHLIINTSHRIKQINWKYCAGNIEPLKKHQIYSCNEAKWKVGSEKDLKWPLNDTKKILQT